jgi:hypothetical protein
MGHLCHPDGIFSVYFIPLRHVSHILLSNGSLVVKYVKGADNFFFGLPPQITYKPQQVALSTYKCYKFRK